jgi:hypothetical protein
MSTDMKKDNFFVCVEYMKPKCPAVVRMENDDFIVKNINNHPSARMRAKLIKKEVMNKTLSSSNVQPLRVLSDITAEVQRQDSAACVLHQAHNLSKDKRVKARMHELYSIVINYEKFEKKTDFFNAIAGL